MAARWKYECWCSCWYSLVLAYSQIGWLEDTIIKKLLEAVKWNREWGIQYRLVDWLLASV